jgi:leader peptidase (prepilin peptidase) / N-methyltransferase
MDVLAANLIWACAMGLAVGNYASSWIYRLPKGESPFSKHPYCGGCGTMLGVKDLYPGLSYLLLRGKCRHCDMVIPRVYWLTEVFCAIIFMWGVVTLGWSQSYLLVALGGTIAVVLWGLEMRKERLFASVLLFLGSVGAVYRVLLDASIYDAAFGMIWGAMVPLLIWRLGERSRGEEATTHISIPVSAVLGAVAGVWLAPLGLLLFLPLWGAMAVLYRLLALRMAWPHNAWTPSFVTALCLVLLNPQWLAALKQLFIEALAA